MAKEKYFKELEEIKKFTKKMNNALNESLAFEDEYDMPEYEHEPMASSGPMDSPEEDLDNEIDTIREIALKGMVKLCKTPEDSRYQFLKKVFSFCDKASESENEETPKK